MRDFNFQTVAILNNRIAQPLRRNPHILSDVKMTHPTGLRGHLMRNLQLSKGAKMLNGKCFSSDEMALPKEG
jgi:hypothetical protein